MPLTLNYCKIKSIKLYLKFNYFYDLFIYGLIKIHKFLFEHTFENNILLLLNDQQ